MSESKFWLALWLIVGMVIISLTFLGIYASVLDDKRDLEMADKGLHKYKVERCRDVQIVNEWHEAGWKDEKSIR